MMTRTAQFCSVELIRVCLVQQKQINLMQGRWDEHWNQVKKSAKIKGRKQNEEMTKSKE